MAAPTEPGQIDLRVRRWEPYDDTIIINGVDLTAITTATMQVRDYRDQVGSPRINLALVAPTGQGLSISVATVGGVPQSTIRTIIDEATIEALLPFPANSVAPGADVNLVWGMMLSGTGFKKTRWFEGAFIIVPGADQA